MNEINAVMHFRAARTRESLAYAEELLVLFAI